MERDRATLDRMLRQVDPEALAQIATLEEELALPEAAPPPPETVLVWLNTGSVNERAEHAYGGVARKLELARNFFVLTPLIVTWLSLAFATVNFSHVVTNGSVASERSFLDLWEAGFDGQGTLPVLTFSHVAYLDAGLLFLIAVLTVAHHIAAQKAAHNVRTLRRLFEQRVRGLVREVDARRTAHEHLLLRGTYASAFGAMGETLKGILADTEAQRARLTELATQRDLELTQLAKVTEQMQEGVTRMVSVISAMHDLGAAVGGAAGATGTAAAALATATTELAGVRADLTASLTGFTNHTTAWSDGIVTSWEASQARHLDQLQAALDTMLTNLSERLETDMVTPLREAPALKASAERIAQLNGAVARLDVIMQDVHRDAATLGAVLQGMARTFGGDGLDDGVIDLEPDDGWVEETPPRR